MFKDLIETLSNLGLINNIYANLILLLIVSITILIAFIKLIWTVFFWCRNEYLIQQENKNMLPYFNEGEIERHTKFYIPHKIQNIAPSIDDELGSGFLAIPKNDGIPLFIDKIFKKSGKENKYYVILADAGMGKSTFLINLLITYRNRINLSLNPKDQIKLFPLGDRDCMKSVEKITDEERKKTILLLDAFDEDDLALTDHATRMFHILKMVKGFKLVVITCRTQFFPTDDEIPTEANYMTFGGAGGYKLQKIYLSVFDQDDINKYLSKKYRFWQFKKRQKAEAIIARCPNLMVRPMLLSHIDDLIEKEKVYVYTFQLYQVLIDKWIDREAIKPGILERYYTLDNFKSLLFNFSKAIARNLYEKHKERKEFKIHYLEDFISSNGLSLQQFNRETELSSPDKRSKSLLNRTADGYYKFSHKSILEFFLSINLLEDIHFARTFDFTGLDMAKRFYNEQLLYYISNIDGKATINDTSITLKDLTLDNLDYITALTMNSPKATEITFCMNHLPSIKTINISKNKYSFTLDIFKCCILLSKEEKGSFRLLQSFLNNHNCSAINRFMDEYNFNNLDYIPRMTYTTIKGRKVKKSYPNQMISVIDFYLNRNPSKDSYIRSYPFFQNILNLNYDREKVVGPVFLSIIVNELMRNNAFLEEHIIPANLFLVEINELKSKHKLIQIIL